METKQINLKLPENLLLAAESYAKNYGYRNLQELASESLREKVFEDNEFDENFSDKEIELIDTLIELSLKKKVVVSEEEINKTLLE
ncbi:MAG: hypothetical protein KJ718_06610 [Nanoarchaeota archaeon]|nr:hypothetical protein [Nanoarchaeota archaeon]MBU1052190.1 hypothetical protein [Nanoarchaeota archaeon]MBU1989016.1 hypothetical protein [Nanoarchaeota archaeon]